MISSNSRLFIPALIEKKLPYLHPKININHLHDNLKLFSDIEIAKIKTWFKDNPNEDRYKLTSSNGQHYSIIKSHDEVNPNNLYAVYYGKEKEIGKGGFGKVKLVQELTSGTWGAIKVEKPRVQVVDQVEQEQAKQDQAKQDQAKQDQAKQEQDKDQEQKQKDLKEQQEAERRRTKLLQAEQAGLKQYNMLFDTSTRKDKPYDLLIMALARGRQLRDFMNTDLSDVELLHMIISICEVVNNVLQKKHLHRDVKPENFIYDRVTGKITLIDYQFYAELSDHFDYQDDIMHGTAGFFAPELIDVCFEKDDSAKFIFNEKTEVYALGMTIAFLLEFTYDETLVRNNVVYPYYQDLKIFSRNDSHVLFNNRIHDFGLRVTTHNFLRLMTALDPNARPTMQACIEFFKNKLSEETNPILITKKIGILDLNEYTSADEKTKKMLLKPLRMMNLVWLFDAKNCSPFALLKLRRELESQNLLVDDKLFSDSASSSSLIRIAKQLPDYIKQQSPDLKSAVYLITKEKLSKELFNDLTKTHVCPILVDEKQSNSAYEVEILNFIRKEAKVPNLMP